MLWPERWPPTFGSGPACWSASPRVPPGGSTTASLSCARARKFRPLSGSWTTSRFSMTSLISAVAVCRGEALAATVRFSDSPFDVEPEVERQRRADLEQDTGARLRRETGERDGDVPRAGAQRGDDDRDQSREY
jgi:hypothetical protein